MRLRTAGAVLVLAGALVSPAFGREQAIEVPGLVDPRTGRAAALPSGAKLLHVVFFATWCPECMAELDALDDLEDRWSDEGYRLVLIAVRTRHTVERLAHFVEERDPPGATRFDSEGAAERSWRVQRVPTHLLLDASGAEVARGASVGDITAEIERRLAGGGP